MMMSRINSSTHIVSVRFIQRLQLIIIILILPLSLNSTHSSSQHTNHHHSDDILIGSLTNSLNRHVSYIDSSSFIITNIHPSTLHQYADDILRFNIPTKFTNMINLDYDTSSSMSIQQRLPVSLSRLIHLIFDEYYRRQLMVIDYMNYWVRMHYSDWFTILPEPTRSIIRTIIMKRIDANQLDETIRKSYDRQHRRPRYRAPSNHTHLNIFQYFTDIKSSSLLTEVSPFTILNESTRARIGFEFILQLMQHYDSAYSYERDYDESDQVNSDLVQHSSSSSSESDVSYSYQVDHRSTDSSHNDRRVRRWLMHKSAIELISLLPERDRGPALLRLMKLNNKLERIIKWMKSSSSSSASTSILSTPTSITPNEYQFDITQGCYIQRRSRRLHHRKRVDRDKKQVSMMRVFNANSCVGKWCNLLSQKILNHSLISSSLLYFSPNSATPHSFSQDRHRHPRSCQRDDLRLTVDGLCWPISYLHAIRHYQIAARIYKDQLQKNAAYASNEMNESTIDDAEYRLKLAKCRVYNELLKLPPTELMKSVEPSINWSMYLHTSSLHDFAYL